MSISLPTIGLGTYSLRGSRGAAAVAAAIESGYRLIDTAYNYENEGVVGRGIADSGIDRDELIVTSKLPGRFQTRDEVATVLEESTYRLGLDHLDLYLIHWPNPKQGRFIDAWRGLVDAREAGLVRHIGVSNFLPEHIEAVEEATGVRPEVNQVELHPRFPQTELLAWHAERGIAVEAWSPLGRGDLLDHPTILHLAQRESISPGALILAWHAAVGSVPLPRSSSPERQRANLAAVERQLSAETVAAVSAIAAYGGRRLWDQDPATYEEF
ncbi:aldo/keto reductase [Corynebacterium halotolerans]|uniref:Oxidoreductase n=1 Tax=Corynebacterium halotolerans YIM 70093 = DSM 44683 TaxID=1121362 RepID=M1P4H0_9CORY|nr:aldo/keto reductase [Corynebacterium halotolerans]AGF71526.1 oxidoreductase [Corynebacterium halotolerans YIM 70093 = DSM 44683]